MNAFNLFLLRHGEPVGAGRLVGRTDAPPTAEGIKACVDRVRDVGAEVLIASDLSRARLAGEAIGLASGVSLSVDLRWREMDFGAWDGLMPAQIDTAELAQFWSDPDRHAPPGGERWSALVQRISDAIRDLAARPTLIVTHGGAMRAALATLCGFDVGQTWAISLPYACLLSLRVWPGEDYRGQMTGLYS